MRGWPILSLATTEDRPAERGLTRTMSDDYRASLPINTRLHKDPQFRADFGVPLHPRFVAHLDRHATPHIKRQPHPDEETPAQAEARRRREHREVERARLADEMPILSETVEQCYYGALSQRQLALQTEYPNRDGEPVSQSAISLRLKAGLALIEEWAAAGEDEQAARQLETVQS